MLNGSEQSGRKRDPTATNSEALKVEQCLVACLVAVDMEALEVKKLVGTEHTVGGSMEMVEVTAGENQARQASKTRAAGKIALKSMMSMTKVP